MGKKIQIKTEEENGIIVMAILAIICIATKILQLFYLPEKYMYDGKRILSQALSGYRSGDLGYDTVEDFFTILIKWFHIEEYSQWSVFLGFVGSVFILWYLRKYLTELYLINAIFFMCSLVLLNIYAFNVSKEFLQVIFFVPAFYCLDSTNEKKQLAGVLVSLLLVGIFLRRYFLLIMAVFLIVYFLFRIAGYLEGNKIIVFFLALAFLGGVGLVFLQRHLPQIYESILGARRLLNQFRMESSDANTMIVDVIKNSVSPWAYLCNLAINFFRLCFPFELLSKGFMQIIFVVYQTILSIKIGKAFFACITGKSLGWEKTIVISFMLAYLIVSAVFEPDFGSFVKHEIVFFPIFCIGLMTDFWKDADIAKNG